MSTSCIELLNAQGSLGYELHAPSYRDVKLPTHNACDEGLIMDGTCL